MRKIPVLDFGWVEYKAHMGDDLTPAEVARECTATVGDDPKNLMLLRNLWCAKPRHYMPFEFCELDVEIKAPIFVVRQLRTHRRFSYLERSARYTVMPSEFYCPETDSGEFRDAYEESRKVYESLLERGVKREKARLVLPMATYTTFRMKGNLAQWLHLLDLRLDEAAQAETRAYANAIAHIIEKTWPAIWKVYSEAQDAVR